MSRPLKVWGGLKFYGALGQKRTIIAAHTAKRARELGGVSISEFKNYWCETGNKRELAAATEEGVWVRTKEFSDDTEILPHDEFILKHVIPANNQVRRDFNL